MLRSIHLLFFFIESILLSLEAYVITLLWNYGMVIIWPELPRIEFTVCLCISIVAVYVATVCKTAIKLFIFYLRKRDCNSKETVI